MAKKSAPGVYDNSADVKRSCPDSFLVSGTEVEIERAEVLDFDCTQTERSIHKGRGRVLGPAYEQTAGPNKGSVMQPVRDAVTGEQLAVPIERLRRVDGAKSRRSFGMPAIGEDRWNEIFGRKERR